jgi:transcriptional regulator with XRE-family HTH domain
VEKSIYSPKHRQLAELLRTLRQSSGLTQKELASRFDRHHPFIHDYETGQRRLDVVRLRAVALALGTTLAAIVEELGQSNTSAPVGRGAPRVESRRPVPEYDEEWARLCAYLRSLRDAAGLTETEVALRLDEPQSFVSKFETKKRRLDLIELEQVAVALDTDLLTLVTEFERRPSESN